LNRLREDRDMQTPPVVCRTPGLLATVLALGLLPLAPALAVDGAREIHQACVATGCFPGDPPGWPVVLTSPGSYVLTSNLAVPDINTRAIEVAASDVHLDLGGFAILGPNVCEPGTGNCPTGVGSADGVAQESPHRRLVVRNGQISGMGSRGVTGSAISLIEDLVISNCGLAGISVTSGLIRGNHVERNQVGIDATSAVVRENMVRVNLSDGIRARLAVLVQDNIIHVNEGWGLFCLFPTSPGAYAGNRISDNDDGQVSAACLEIGTNLCGVDTICP
jgi:hypothetical protein